MKKKPLSLEEALIEVSYKVSVAIINQDMKNPGLLSDILKAFAERKKDPKQFKEFKQIALDILVEEGKQIMNLENELEFRKNAYGPVPKRDDR